jgi:transposase
MNAPDLTLPANLTAAAASRRYALHVLEAHGGNRAAAARSLGVYACTLQSWIRVMEAEGLTVPAPHHRTRKVATA